MANPGFIGFVANEDFQIRASLPPAPDGRCGTVLLVRDNEDALWRPLLQRRLPTSKAVKVFNNVFFKHLGSLARTVGAGDRSALPIAGEDPDTKTAVTALLDAIGVRRGGCRPAGRGVRSGWVRRERRPVWLVRGGAQHPSRYGRHPPALVTARE